MDEAVKVYFCDLCNESVPERDVEVGAAKTVKGKVVGVCCLPLLFGPGQSVAAPGSGAPSARGPAPAVVSQGSSLVFLGAVLLAAIAGGAYFLDWRTRSELRRHEQEVARIGGELAAHGKTLTDLNARSTQVASRQEVEAISLQARQAAGPIGDSVRGLEEKITAGATRDQRSRDELKRTLDNVAQRQAAADQVLVTLGEELKKMAGDLQAVRQMPLASGTFGGGPPRGEPSEPMPGKPVESSGGAEGGIPPALSHFVKQLADPDAGTRWSAVEKLTGSGEKRVVAPLLPVLKDADPFVRRICAAGLGELGAREAAPALIEALADAESIVRDAAYRSLRKLTGQSVAFDPEAGADKRAEGVRRWNEWWKANKESFLAGK